MSLGRNIHDALFKRTLREERNARDFLHLALPTQLKELLDLEHLTVRSGSHVSEEMELSLSDVVISTRLKEPQLDTDIYILFEHKSYHAKGVMLQLLGYMLRMWEQDFEQQRPFRLVIPLVYYHGPTKWTVPQQFLENFTAVPDGLTPYVPDFRYELFNTAHWDLQQPENAPIASNIFLMTTLFLMKSAYGGDVEAVRRIVRFWREQGFVSNVDDLLIFFNYVAHTIDVTVEGIEEIIEQEQSIGGDVMPTLAQRLREEGRNEGIRKTQELTALRLIKTGNTIDFTAEISQLPRERVEKIAAKIRQDEKSK